MASAAIQPSDPLSGLGKLAQAIRQWPLGVHLLLSVNVPMVIMLAALLVSEYRDEMEQATLEKESGLADEAIAVHQAVLHLAHEHGTKSTDAFVRRVCSKMQDTRSPGHSIIVVDETGVINSTSHGGMPADSAPRLLNTFRQGRSRLRAQEEVIVLGGFEESGITVVVAELATNIRRGARREVIWQLGSLSVLAVIAATIVDTVLWRLIRSPLRRISATVDAVARGELGITLTAPVGRELQALALSFNSMSEQLATNERRRRQEMSRAREIQEHLLPIAVQIPGLNVCCEYQPAEDVAGDYYDLIPLSNGSWLIVVADVAGHGIPAALAATLLKALLLCVSEHCYAPEEILRQVNERFVSLMPPGRFVTVLLAVWHREKRRLTYVNAGHPPGLVWNERSGLRELDATAMPVGILDGAVYQACELDLAGDEKIVWFTDGLTEAYAPSGEMFGMARLRDLIVQQGTLRPEQLRGAILAAVSGFVGDTVLSDDLTLLVAGLDVDQSQPAP